MTDFSDLKRNLQQIFYGVSDSDILVDCPYRIESHINRPPSYITKLALFIVGEFENYGQSDKSEWTAFLNYEGYTFEI